MNPYLKMVEAGVSISIGKQLIDMAEAIPMEFIGWKVGLAVVGGILVLVNILVGATGVVEASIQKWFALKFKYEGKARRSRDSR